MHDYRLGRLIQRGAEAFLPLSFSALRWLLVGDHSRHDSAGPWSRLLLRISDCAALTNLSEVAPQSLRIFHPVVGAQGVRLERAMPKSAANGPRRPRRRNGMRSKNEWPTKSALVSSENSALRLR